MLFVLIADSTNLVCIYYLGVIYLNRSLKLWQIGCFIFTGIAGVLLHFLYGLTNGSIIIAPFSAVNESIWEHMKLLFFPTFAFAAIEYTYIGKDYENFWCAKLTGALSGLLLIPVLFYTYTGALGVIADWFNVVIFFIAAGTSYYVETLLLKNRAEIFKTPCIAFIILCMIALLFVILTFVQPEIPLFMDMSTGNYGI